MVQDRFSVRFALACAICLSAPLAIFTGTSNFFQQRAPELSLTFNPFNAEARINHLIAGLSRYQRQAGKAGLEEVRQEAEWQLAYSPADARGYSLLGETYYLSGEHEIAMQLFGHALARSKTEIHALQRSIELLANQGRFAEALERADLTWRRWPDHFERIAPHLAAMLQAPAAYEKALELLQQSPPWTSRFFRALAGDEAGLLLAYRLHDDLHRLHGQSLPDEAAGTMRSLLNAGRADLAHRLFLFTQSEADRRLAGYVFNGEFAARPGPRPFDWQARDNASAEVKWAGDASGGDSEIRIRFLGKPVRNIHISQTLYLPPGSYSLSMEYSASGLETPRGLFLRLACFKPRRPFARIDIPPQRVSREILAADFEVPEQGCSLFRIGMETGLIAESFYHAYRGTLSLHAVRIERRDL